MAWFVSPDGGMVSAGRFGAMHKSGRSINAGPFPCGGAVPGSRAGGWYQPLQKSFHRFTLTLAHRPSVAFPARRGSATWCVVATIARLHG
jgi:hypothetical protein